MSKLNNKNWSKDDYKWKSLHEKLEKAMKNNDNFQIAYIYAEMVKFKRERNIDASLIFSNYIKFHKIALSEILKSYIDSEVVDNVEIINNPGCCEECAQAHGIYNLKEILEKQPLPIQSCSNVWCKCDYIAVLKALDK
ncbi:MAG: hypothetical protein Q7K65_02330 [Candidatus Buchananbacteria bacterium]|nr:hypothetical protein [Candidatus Buchananbacteria bacterium]